MISFLILSLGLSVALTYGTPVKRNNVNSGQITYYDPAVGACGILATGSEAVAAISIPMWNTRNVGTNPNNNGNCGRQIRITNVAGRATDLIVSVTDRCVGCAPGDLDVSPSVFGRVLDMGVGRSTAEWQFVD